MFHDVRANLLAHSLIVPSLHRLHQCCVTCQHQLTDSRLIFTNQFRNVITVNQQRQMLTQSFCNRTRGIRTILSQYLWNRFLVTTLQQSQLIHEILIVLWLECHFLHEELGIFLLIINGQATRHKVDLRSVHLSAIMLHLPHTLLLLVPLDA